MRKLCFFLALLIFSGCASFEQQPVSPPPPEQRKVSATAAQAQYRAAQKAFNEKLEAAPGLTLAALRVQWGQVRQGITRGVSTIYHWTRTITVTPPEGTAGALTPRTMSCMAVFIVQDGVVVEASSEGQCLDYGLMPAWQPVCSGPCPG